MQIRLFLFLTASFCLLLACSKQPSTTSPHTSSAAATSATAPAAAAPTTELEPVMPEKVQVAFERNCKACHGPDGHGITSVAPDLRRAPRRNLSEWIAFMKDPKGAHSTTKVPVMAALTEDDFEAIGGYLADLTQNNPPAAQK